MIKCEYCDDVKRILRNIYPGSGAICLISSRVETRESNCSSWAETHYTPEYGARFSFYPTGENPKGEVIDIFYHKNNIKKCKCRDRIFQKILNTTKDKRAHRIIFAVFSQDIGWVEDINYLPLNPRDIPCCI